MNHDCAPVNLGSLERHEWRRSATARATESQHLLEVEATVGELHNVDVRVSQDNATDSYPSAQEIRCAVPEQHTWKVHQQCAVLSTNDYVHRFESVEQVSVDLADFSRSMHHLVQHRNAVARNHVAADPGTEPYTNRAQGRCQNGRSQ